MAIQQNPSLPISYQVPGVYVFLSRAGAAPPVSSNRVLLLGYKTSAGLKPAGSPVRILSEDDVVQAAGRGSDLHRMYRAFVAQSPSTGAELWIMPMNAPAGAAQTRLIKIMQAPLGAVLGTSNTGALAAGYISVWIAGYRFDCQIAIGDTFATIAANLCAQIQAAQDALPCTASVVGDTITLTARHAALSSADLPVIVTVTGDAMQIAASPGTLTVSGTASGAGAVSVGVETRTAGAAIANTDTATAINTALIAAINAAAAFPAAAAQPSTPGAVATLFYVADRVFNFAATSITSAITTTISAAWGTDAAGLPSAATPSLASVLTTLEGQQAYKLWITPFTGAGSYVTTAGFSQSGSASSYAALGALSQHIETQGDGLRCKGQILMISDTRALATAGSIPSSTTPALTASPRTFLTWCAGSPQQAVETAARCASIVMQMLPQYPNFNYAGQALQTDSRTPYLLPHDSVRPSDSDCNAAMLSYNVTPLRSNAAGQLAIVSGRTTAKPSATMDYRYAWWGVALADDYIRDDLLASIPALIQGKNTKLYSPPRTQFATGPDAIRTGVAVRMRVWDSLDIFDGADSLTPGLGAEVNEYLGSRTDVVLPKRFAVPNEQVSVFAAVAA